MSQNEMKAADGMVEMVIAAEDGKVIQRFKTPMQIVKYEPQNAIDVAMAMTDAAFEVRDGVKPAGETLKAELVDRHRTTLTQRIAIMMPQLRKMTDGKAAKTMVETVLKEIF